MIELMIQIIIGILLIMIGISNMKGNITLLHSYHRKRVKKEDELPFGKKVGTGIIITGSTIIISSILFTISSILKEQLYSYIANIILTLGLITGLIIILYALFKYNKGIF